MDVCKNCGAELTHVEGRRKKEFCSDNCRATFWQKNTKKKKTETVVKDLTKPTDVKKPFEQPKSNFTINTRPKTLDELKSLCPKGLDGIERGIWIGIERQKYGI